MSIHAAILNHMVDIAHFLLGHLITGNYSSVQEYIHNTNMDREGTRGTEIEMWSLAHLLQTPIVSYVTLYTLTGIGTPYSKVDRTLNDDLTHMCMYIRFDSDHFTVVCSVRK